MNGFAEYEEYDALGLAGLVRRKEVTPLELLEAAIERVEARNPAINAVTMKLYDYGRKAIVDGLRSMGAKRVAVATAASRTRPLALKNSVVHTDSKPASSARFAASI